MVTDPKLIETIKRVAKVTAVRNYPSGEGEGYAGTLDGQSVVFIDEAGEVRRVPLADLSTAPPAPAQP